MSNAVQASAAMPGACPVGVWLLTDHRALLILVWDASPHPPSPREAGAFSEHGRGLLLVAHFSAEWNWYPTPGTGGKMVWALLTTGTPAKDAPSRGAPSQAGHHGG